MTEETKQHKARAGARIKNVIDHFGSYLKPISEQTKGVNDRRKNLYSNITAYVQSVKERSNKYLENSSKIPMMVYLFTWLNNFDNGFITAASSYIFLKTASMPPFIKALFVISVFVCNTVNQSIESAHNNHELFNNIVKSKSQFLKPYTLIALVAASFNFFVSYIASKTMLLDLGWVGPMTVGHWSAILSLLYAFCFFTFINGKADKILPSLSNIKNMYRKSKWIFLMSLVNVLAIGVSTHLLLMNSGIITTMGPISCTLYIIGLLANLDTMMVVYTDALNNLGSSGNQGNMSKPIKTAAMVSVFLNASANCSGVMFASLSRISNFLLAGNAMAISFFLNSSIVNKIDNDFFSATGSNSTLDKTIPSGREDQIRLILTISKALMVSIPISIYGIRSLSLKAIFGLGFTTWSISDKNASYVKIVGSDFSRKVTEYHDKQQGNWKSKLTVTPNLFCKYVINTFTGTKIQQISTDHRNKQA